MLMKKLMKKAVVFSLATLVAGLLSSSASAENLVLNGDFSDYTGQINHQLKNPTGAGSGSTFTVLNNWTVGANPTTSSNQPLNVLVAKGWNNTGATTLYGTNDLKLRTTLSDGHGHPTGQSNGFTDAPRDSNYIVADGAKSYQGAISQVIDGAKLVDGQQYAISFDWATGQQVGDLFIGATYDKGWNVSFGGETLRTPLVNDVEFGFSGLHGGSVDLGDNTVRLDSGWFHTTLTFTYNANAANANVLSFLAQGSPDGVPPFVMLANVSMEAVPEPAAFVTLGLGIAGLAALRFRGRKAG